MEKYSNNLTRKHRNLGLQVASEHDNSEPERELEELQRSLAARIRAMERVAEDGQSKEAG